MAAEAGRSPRLATRLLIGALGRPIACSACGRTIFKGFPYVLRGKLRLVGADRHLVHVSFDDQNTLRFRHGSLDECPTPDRPWLS
jgi:hypothetical protein